MQPPKYTIPAYAALKSVTQEVMAADPVEPKLPPTSMRQAQTNWLLDKLQEESAEVIQAVSKIRRFGPNSSHPERTTTNYQELIQELEDFLAILAALDYCKYLELTKSDQNILSKTHRLLLP